MKIQSEDLGQAFAPATVANVAVGFDCLGFALEGVGDTVTVQRIPRELGGPRVHLETNGELPRDPQQNTATAGLISMIRDFDLDFDFRVTIEKGIAMSSGMGGSAASAVAGSLAASVFLPRALTESELLNYALDGEVIASGSRHADNVGPSLRGGLVLIGEKGRLVSLPVPAELRAVVVHPGLQLKTALARGVLRREVVLGEHVRHASRLAALVHACHAEDFALLAEVLRDDLIEPQRQHLIPGFSAVQAAAREAGALGCSISGAGPSVFAWVQGSERAEVVKQSMLSAWGDMPHARAWVSSVSSSGARVL